MADERYRFEHLGQQHNRQDFSCGVEALDRYFRQLANQDFRRSLAVPYVLTEIATGNVIGYYTLSSLSIISTSLPDELTRRLARYKEFPTILLGRLAVDQRYRGQGFGELLLVDALRRCFAISKKMGAMSVVVDAKDDNALTFYERYGFIRFIDQEHRLYLPMATIARLEL